MSNRMWGGRFSSGPDAIMEEINASIGFDKRLYKHDIAGSIAHATMLEAAGILTRDDKDAIISGLETVRAEIEAGAFTFSRALEDIHMNVESRLKELVGEPAGRLHTARSRNDQVATDFKLYVRDGLDMLAAQVETLQKVLVEKAEAEAGTVMPGFTHLQSAQPVTFGHHMLAYVEMLERDKGRLLDARARLNESPLGAAALAGTSFPIDREMTAEALGFDRPMANSLDAVSDRDFILETLSAASICAMHLSRLSEELVIWSSAQFAFVKLSDKFSTGSSIMPQKRNPDAAELIRAKVGRIFAAFTSLLMVMKGLPLAYSKDMLAGAGGQRAVPRRAPYHRARGGGGGSQGLRAGRVDHRGFQGHRRADHQPGVQGAWGGQFGQVADQLWRHGAGKRYGAGCGLARAAGDLTGASFYLSRRLDVCRGCGSDGGGRGDRHAVLLLFAGNVHPPY